MDVCKTIDEIRGVIKAYKKEGKSVGFVPTMGALHEGHLSLIQIAKEQSDVVVVSIFVNPEQFGPNEDFENYPRELQSDLDKCESEGVAAVFAPNRDDIYDEKKFIRIEVDELNRNMCGGSRPGFFEGILLIVNKLFNIVEPDVAVFGQKDIQQFLIINQMVKEFNHEVKLLMAPIKRANDGLALSSRNKYLSNEEREIAPGLYRTLTYIEKQIRGGVDTPKLLLDHQKSELEAKGFKIDYLNVFDKKTLQPAKVLKKSEEYILAGAVWLGKTRLIDNFLIEL
ncbi:pantoate--beta-alanine ligase [Rhodohalobacter barkolensis]|uniref:Pantothenate synthetase n=1 Tax=Rhodohalobacter barkolensis TaxID=2053187 RepID=A0A2N0VHA9_9BACT|nr:pantoate--beta-alanine ligase [Rhodohalobacter barkolensis]PKD43518.1 pantoate--beta-alanine ligase [Rhodohalobacter barkolensis]